MNRDVETILNAATIAELQPPCDWVLIAYANNEPDPSSECKSAALFVRRAHCARCGAATLRLRCPSHTISVGPHFCATCGCDAECVIDSIEPLR